MCRLTALGSLYLFNTCTSRHIDILHIDINGMPRPSVSLVHVQAQRCRNKIGTSQLMCMQSYYAATVPCLKHKAASVVGQKHQSLDSSTSQWTFAPVIAQLHQSLDVCTNHWTGAHCSDRPAHIPHLRHGRRLRPIRRCGKHAGHRESQDEAQVHTHRGRHSGLLADEHGLAPH